ncbi:MAG: hypothetical protein HQ582_09740 [Planctomycetes bacterium]|nr:hypothetical protein [Planctomycetota bacterium]
MNRGESYPQASPHGYRRLLRHRPGRPAWWLNEPDEAADRAAYADHWAIWPGLLNAAEKPPAGGREVPSNLLAPDQLVTALEAGFQEDEKH